jgi:hypothetical protein
MVTRKTKWGIGGMVVNALPVAYKAECILKHDVYTLPQRFIFGKSLEYLTKRVSVFELFPLD